MTNATSYTVISISMDGTWAGSGKLRDGVIEDCGAQFCANVDESMEVYDMIEEAIAAGKSKIKVELDDSVRLIEWTITEPM